MRVVCSIGPNVKGISDLDDLVLSGMTDARFNFSHANYEKMKTYIAYLKEYHKDVRVIQDLQGNKIRVSKLYKRDDVVKKDQDIFLCSEKFFKTNPKFSEKFRCVPMNMEFSFDEIKREKKVFMKDRQMEFYIEGKVKDREVLKGVVIRGGAIRAEKGLNFPSVIRKDTKLLAKDREDIKFGLLNGVDVICLSYVASAAIVTEFNKFIDDFIKAEKLACKKPVLWAKIECREGVKNLDEILKKVNGIMLGRGDLYSEVSLFEIADMQEAIIKKMKTKKTKELIIGTYVMESMRKSEIPSLAEVNELNHFIESKVDGVMLAGEVGVGRYPTETVDFVAKFISKKINPKVKEIQTV